MRDASELLTALSMEACGIPQAMRDAYDRQQIAPSQLVDVGANRLRKLYGPEIDLRWLEAAAMLGIAGFATGAAILERCDAAELAAPMHSLGVIASRIGVAFACRARACAEYPELVRGLSTEALHVAAEDEFELQCSKTDALHRFCNERTLMLAGDTEDLPLYHIIGSDALLKVVRYCPEASRRDAAVLSTALGTVADTYAPFLQTVLESGEVEWQTVAQAYVNGIITACALLDEWAAGRLEWIPIPGINAPRTRPEDCDA